MEPTVLPMGIFTADERAIFDRYMSAMMRRDLDTAERAMEELNRLPREKVEEKPKPVLQTETLNFKTV